jgi:beta-1,2-mannobiose phosphorylase / 1,2-beta-oligomannan phosphorylase
MNTTLLQPETALDLADRFPQNPLLTPQDIQPSTPGLKVECLLNPAAFRFDGRVWLLLRVAERPEQTPGVISFPVLDNGTIRIQEFSKNDPRLDDSDPRVINFDGEDFLTTLSHLQLVSSEDGVHFREEPSFPRLMGEGPYETFGIEDCRVSRIGSRYYLTYSTCSPNGVIVGMRSTEDWREFIHHGVAFTAHNKDCALFDEKIGGKYYALHRPSSPEIGGNYIWIAESEDLIHWGNHRCIARTRPGMWDSARVGAGAAPIRTERGWLEIYHGATAENRYCLGALLLDLDEPWKVLARSREPIMEPVAAYEKVGFFGNVVFTNGHVVDGDQLTVYYGASDSVICAARFSIRAILSTL